MRASEVIQRLQRELPKLTNLFTTQFSIISLTRSGSTITAVTATDHNLVDDQQVLITGATELNPITNLTFLDGIASAVTFNPHDLTVPSSKQIKEDNLFGFNKAFVSGAVETEFNGTFTILSAVNRKNFTYPVTGTPSSPATGIIILEQDFGYNGRFPVTVLSSTSFSYEITTTPVSPAGGIIIGHSPARISGALELERIVRSYTKKVPDELWAFVVLGDVTASRNRAILSDAVNESSQGDEYRNRLIEPFSVYVFIPAVQFLSAREVRDDIEDIRTFIYKSVLGFVFSTGLNDEPWSQTTPLGDRFVKEGSTEAFYIHEFSFERVIDVTLPDAKDPDLNSAFRDMDLDATFDFGTGDLDADIDIDEQPLP